MRLIILGNTAKLAAENETIRALIKTALAEGVIIDGCLACAKSLDVEKQLTNLGVSLSYMGQPLTEILKNDRYLLTI
ncbi:hypothetical protein KHQ89_07220 [Mycoplasmatota bacterium]|nr:hypothetical protein KHQ89_07220 [Mycoplasmatota bacterium]